MIFLMRPGNGIVPVVLLMLIAANLVFSHVQASASQEIYELRAPNTANTGSRFTVSIRVRYDFTGQGDVEVWARVRNPLTTGDVARAVEDTKTVRGKGDLSWSFQIDAASSAGNRTLEAYAFHWEDRMTRPREAIDDTRKFWLIILGAASTTISTPTTIVSPPSSTKNPFAEMIESIVGRSEFVILLLLVVVSVIVAVITVRKRKTDASPKSVSFCISCGSKIAVGSSFCPKCGEKKIND